MRDVEIYCADETSVRTHPAILASRSPKLRRRSVANPDEPARLAAGIHPADTLPMRQIALPIATAVVRDFFIFLTKEK